MVVISASLAAVLYLQLEFPLAEAGRIGFGTLMLMVLAEFFAARNDARTMVETELGAIFETAAGLGRETAAMTTRVAALEGSLERRIDEAVDPRLEALTAEMHELELTVARLREEVARLRTPAHGRRGPAASPSREEQPQGAFAGMDRHDAVELIRRAIADERLKVFLQPIVMLPQRRVCHYEALARLRGEDGAFFLPSDFLAVAEPAGLTPLIDDAVLTRSLRIARHLSARSSDMMVFCNLSARSLADGRLFARITEAVERARDLAGKLVFELRQEMLDDLGPLETSGLQALGELGARFSIDGRHLDIDGAAWAARRVRFAKINAGMLLDPPSSSGAHIHAADLAKLLARSGIELIAARIESEAELVDLLDYDIRFG